MFRRSKTETPAATTTAPEKAGGKGRPTPTRKEAEAAAKARAKAPRTRKELAASQRTARTESSRKVREAMKSGDERYYPARDRGPMRRFVRDYVDARFSLIELVIPLLLVTLVLGYSGNPTLARWGNTLLMIMVLFVLLDMVTLRFRLRRELARRFPDESHKGLTYYAITRALQMKFMRLPKAQVKVGQKLPDHYR
ncbi:MAG TPA: DUF3043 domain-containing protein [Nocardioides sp.]|nr:DUF3043 domain-containing protein [Nocardioides sp.]